VTPFRFRLQSALVARQAEHERAERALAAAKAAMAEADANLVRLAADRAATAAALSQDRAHVASGDPAVDATAALQHRLRGQRLRRLLADEQHARTELQRRTVQRDLAARDEAMRAAAVKALHDLAARERAEHQRACERRADAERLDDHLVRWRPASREPA